MNSSYSKLTPKGQFIIHLYHQDIIKPVDEVCWHSINVEYSLIANNFLEFKLNQQPFKYLRNDYKSLSMIIDNELKRRYII